MSYNSYQDYMKRVNPWIKKGSTFYNFGHEVWNSCLKSFPNDVPEPKSEKKIIKPFFGEISKPNFEKVNAVKTTEDIKIALERRSDKFKSELASYIPKYGGVMIDKFFTYWSEPNRSYTKMKFEMQKTWDTKRRLHTWAMNNFGGSSFNKKEPPQMKEL